jgi:tRNA-2-methylthio-N6-dimethylallyladenosine synthase
MIDDVPEAEKDRRFAMLNEQHERITAEINRQFENTVVEVLVESDHKGKWRGRTPQNKLVFFEDGSQDWRGRIAPVRIGHAGAWSMQGTL